MQKKYFFLLSLLIVGVCFFPHTKVQAQQAEKMDPRCFTKAECSEARIKMGIPPTEASAGFYNNTGETSAACLHREDAEQEELGFCLPVGQTSTSIKFGGTARFANIGVFIQYIYKYGMIFASILAVIIIIVSGLQWTASGGNSSTIESAKTRITGAITGLVLAASAYIILNTINPSTVNLRLPQVWLLREEKLQNEYKYCLEIPAKPIGKTGFEVPKVAPYKVNYQSIPPTAFQPAFSIASGQTPESNIFPDKRETSIEGSKCGDKMVIEGTDGTSCISTYCPGGQICRDDKKSCEALGEGDGNIVGNISWYTTGKYLDKIWLEVACNKDGEWDINQIGSQSLGEAKTSYYFNDVVTQAIDECDGRQNIGGFFFILEVNDSESGATIDDQWIGGKSLCRQANTGGGNSCGVYGTNGSIDQSDTTDMLLVDGMAHTGQLFSADNMSDGISCDIKITKEGMPNLGNGIAVTFTSGLGHLLGGTVGALVDTMAGANSGNAVGTDFCPYLKAQSAQFEAAVKERQKKYTP